jgi:hypothetical protein
MLGSHRDGMRIATSDPSQDRPQAAGHSPRQRLHPRREEALRTMSVEDEALAITNEAGRCFEVRRIRKGDRYGLNGCLVHDGDEDLIEFQDVTPGQASLSPERHFVARYPARVILRREEGAGLWLYGRTLAWRIEPDEVRRVRDWLLGGR